MIVSYPFRFLTEPSEFSLQVRHVRCRIGEVRRVRNVERIGTDLNGDALRDFEIAKDVEVQVGAVRPAEGIKTGVSEAHCSDRGEGERVEVGLAIEAAADVGDIRQNLVGRLRVARAVTRSGRRSDTERDARVVCK